jgi:signal transduction histidine kinase
MLRHLAGAIEQADDSARPLKGAAHEYAVRRWRAGCDLRQVLSELRVLRGVIAGRYAAAVAGTHVSLAATLNALDRMHDAPDRGLSNVVEQYNCERDHTRESVISILSHDLRQPLNAIRVAAGALTTLDELDAERVRRVATIVAASATRADALIGDLLDVARADVGSGLPVVLGRVDVSRLLSATADEVAAAQSRTQVAIPR